MTSNPLKDESVKGKKRTHSPGEAEPSKRAKYRPTAQTEKMEEVDTTVKRLKDKHTSSYAEVKLRSWADLIHMEKRSYNMPPDISRKETNLQECQYLTPLYNQQQVYPHASDLPHEQLVLKNLISGTHFLKKEEEHKSNTTKIMSDMLSM